MSYIDLLTCWELYQKGMAGPSVHYITAYNNYAMIHALTQIMIAVNSKGYTQKKPEGFETIFNEAYKIMALQSGKQSLPMEVKAAQSLIMASSGAPKWLIDAVKQETEDGSTTTEHTSNRSA